MFSRLAQRRSQLGQSFTTCLLMVVLFFGGIGTYYFKVFQWRHLEAPLSDLLHVKNDDSAALADFRRYTTPNIIDPGLQILARVVKLRKATNAGTQIPEEFEQNCKEIANALRDLMNQAKLRRIPNQYTKQYDSCLNGISEAYRSLRALEAAVYEEIPDAKKRHIEESIKMSRKGKANLEVARRFFHIQQR